MAVEFHELQGSPTEDVTLAGFRATRKLKCAWSSRHALIAEQLFQPYVHRPDAFCKSGKAVPFPGGEQLGEGSVAAYELAQVTLQYGTPTAADVDNPTEEGAITESIEPWSEFTTIAHEGLQFGFGPTGIPLSAGQAPGRSARGFDYGITRHNVVFVPSIILSYIDCVNSDEMTSRTLGDELVFAIETLLFMPPRIQHTINSNGEHRLNIGYRFSYRPNWDDSVEPSVAHGWNAHWHEKSQTYVRIYDSEKATSEADYYRNYPAKIFSDKF